MKSTRKLISIAAASAAAVLLTACAGGAPYGTTVAGLPGIMGLPGVVEPAPVTSGYGTVASVQFVPGANQGGLGNIAGTVLGNGLPTGQGDLTSVATAVAVAMMTNQAGTQNGTSGVYRVTVRLDNGEVRTFDYAELPNLRVNDRVRVEGNQLFR